MMSFLFALVFLMPAMALGDGLSTENTVSVCYNYSCNKQGDIELKGYEWDDIETIFKSPPDSSQEERVRIASAIALMEQLSGEVLGTSQDKKKNSGTGDPGQMDCIDESKNTTTYLRLFEKKGWIRWHGIQEPVRRNPYFFDIHWGAVIQENNSRQKFVVDSWFRDNGEVPVILKLEDWKSKKEKL